MVKEWYEVEGGLLHRSKEEAERKLAEEEAKVEEEEEARSDEKGLWRWGWWRGHTQLGNLQPPTACLTASGAASELPSRLMHRWGKGPGYLLPRTWAIGTQA